MFELIDLIKTLWTELVAWFIASLILPGAVVAAVLDQMTLLDRGQLWTLSVVCSVVLFVTLAYALNRIDRADDVFIWYPVLAISLAIVAAVLIYGFKARWVGAFLSRFRFGPELFNINLWMPTVIQVAIASVIALTGTVVVLVARGASIALSRTQVWMLAFLLNAVLAYALTWWGLRRQWFLFESDSGFPQSMFEETIAGGGLLVVMLNMAAMVLGCFLYFGVRARMLGGIFEYLAPAWPDWLS